MRTMGEEAVCAAVLNLSRERRWVVPVTSEHWFPRHALTSIHVGLFRVRSANSYILILCFHICVNMLRNPNTE